MHKTFSTEAIMQRPALPSYLILFIFGLFSVVPSSSYSSWSLLMFSSSTSVSFTFLQRVLTLCFLSGYVHHMGDEYGWIMTH